MNLTRKLMNREAFMGLFIMSVGGIASLVFGIPIIAYMLGPLIQQPKSVWRDVGAVTDFPVGETKHVILKYPGTVQWSGPTDLTAAWIRRNPPSEPTPFTAFAVYCTHLGCPVQWLQTPKIFLCPCHGSVFYGDGKVAGGPAPRPLFTYQTRIVSGRLQVRTEAQPLTT
jgi:menaquinol-cytochrome c reductase iron-sulfur subunit